MSFSSKWFPRECRAVELNVARGGRLACDFAMTAASDLPIAVARHAAVDVAARRRAFVRVLVHAMAGSRERRHDAVQ